MSLDNGNTQESEVVDDIPTTASEKKVLVVEDEPDTKKVSLKEKLESMFLYNKSFDEIEAEVEKISLILNKDKSKLTAEEQKLFNKYEADLVKDDSYIVRLFKAFEDQRRLYLSTDYLTNVIVDRIANGGVLEEAFGKLNHQLSNKKKNTQDPNIPLKPMKLQGKAGKVEMMERFRGICRVPLLNSGFWITIKSQALLELNSFFESIDIEDKTYGRLLGGHYYLYYDHHIKQTFIDIITKSIVDSSLKGYYQSKVFEKALKLNDYDVLVGAACFMLFRNGIEIDVPCIHENCGNIETVEVDLSKIRYNDMTLLDEFCISTVLESSSESLTLEDLEVYQEHLKLDKAIVEGDHVITCEVPSMYRYFEYGNKAIAKLTNGIHGNDIHAANFASTINSLATYTYLPWIKKLEINPNTPDWAETDDGDIILENLEMLIYENYDVLADIQTKFIVKSKVSFMCYPGTKCPKCGGSPNGQDVNYQPADTQMLFFYLSTQQLRKPPKGLKNI